jgi:hypothetical protein
MNDIFKQEIRKSVVCKNEQKSVAFKEESNKSLHLIGKIYNQYIQFF